MKINGLNFKDLQYKKYSNSRSVFPSDHVLLQQLEDTVEKLVLGEKDTDVLHAVQKSIHDLVTYSVIIFLFQNLLRGNSNNV